MAKIYLEKYLRHRIKIIGKDKRIYEGELLAADPNLNIVLNDTEEFRETKKKNDVLRRYLGLCMFRGDYIVTTNVISGPVPDVSEKKDRVYLAKS